jgi:type III pantothenate kinase
MLWAIDVGNTRTVSGAFIDRRVLRRHVVPTGDILTRDGARRWAGKLKRRGSAKGFIISSVVPKADPMIGRAIHRVTGADALFVRPDMDLGMRLNVHRPREVGADRIVNALAARTLFGPPCIIVDFGTATTFDVVDSHGDYRGGAILSGIEMALRAMHLFTAKLPSVEFKPIKAAIGRSTVDAMRSGVYFGAIGQIRELLLRIRKELGQVAPAIATGGFCQKFKDTGIFHYFIPDLTLLGLSLVWKRLHE